MRNITLAAGAILVASTSLSHAESQFNAARTFEFDPDKTGCVVANWKNGLGLPDANPNTNFGLRLEKNCATSVNASAGAVLNNIKNELIPADGKFGFDLKDTSPCGAGAPRFNVQQQNGTFHFLGGCSNATKTVAAPGWSRYTIDPYNPAQAFPPLVLGSPLASVVLIVDEEGSYILDNIMVNGTYAGKP